jgi:rhodanese-related sulfurtransferase
MPTISRMSNQSAAVECASGTDRGVAARAFSKAIFRV